MPSARALWFLALIAFIESSVFPIPGYSPYSVADRAAETGLVDLVLITVASVLGGYGGYLIGALFFESVGKWVLELYGKLDKFEASDMYNEQGAWIVFFAGITPFPYKVITIASGVTKLDPITFGIASVLARGLRFGIICALLYFFGAPIRAFIEKSRLVVRRVLRLADRWLCPQTCLRHTVGGLNRLFVSVCPLPASAALLLQADKLTNPPARP